MIKVTFLKVLMLIRQVNQKRVLFAIIGILWIKDLMLLTELAKVKLQVYCKMLI